MASIIQYITHLPEQSQATFQHLGPLGVPVYAALVAGLGVVLLPLSPFAMGAGVIFGFWGGFMAITLGTNAVSAINFLIARYVARDAISRRLSQNEKFRRIDAAVGREGWKIIALLRLCPLPFGLANYCYGLTAVGFWPYFLATFVAIIPANAFFVYLGASTHAFTGSGAHAANRGEQALMGIGVVAGFFALTYITRVAKAAVSRTESSERAVAEPAQVP